MTEKESHNLETLCELLHHSQHGVAFTGAGISTESGIPDFRSPGGLWDKYKPIYFDEFITSEEMRRESWRRKIETDKVLSQAAPNSGHLAIANLVKAGKIKSVITQNIDNLHQQSGIDDHNVIELHGNRTYAVCLDCHTRYSLQLIMQEFRESEKLPTCDLCGGIVKTATISFGQAMPVDKMRLAEKATLACDLFIVLGSSLSVYPAAGFPEVAKRNGAKLVIINRDPTDLDDLADLVFNTTIGSTLEKALKKLDLN